MDFDNTWRRVANGTESGNPVDCLSDSDCDDGNVCTADICTPAGVCENRNEPDRTACPDELFCNGEETCLSGECTDGPDPCVDTEHCDEERMVCLACVSDDECDDQNPCTQDACILNICVHTTIPDCRLCETSAECEDGNMCTDDVCLLVQGQTIGRCLRHMMLDGTPCPDDFFCNGEETCLSGECTDGPDPCIDQDHCDEERMVCLACISDDECDDGDPCTEDACVENECVHTPEPGCESAAYLDIKPGSCPNPVSVRSKGVVPTAIVGSDAFDVTQIDVSSVVLTRADGVGGIVTPAGRVRGHAANISDVATPFTGELCDCHNLTGDGIDDLSLKFLTRELVETLDLRSVPRHTFVTLTISGSLLDGSEFSASDCIRIVGKR